MEDSALSSDDTYQSLVQNIYPDFPSLITKISQNRRISNEAAKCYIEDQFKRTINYIRSIAAAHGDSSKQSLLTRFSEPPNAREQERNAQRYTTCIRKTEILTAEVDTIRRLYLRVKNETSQRNRELELCNARYNKLQEAYNLKVAELDELFPHRHTNNNDDDATASATDTREIRRQRRDEANALRASINELEAQLHEAREQVRISNDRMRKMRRDKQQSSVEFNKSIEALNEYKEALYRIMHREDRSITRDSDLLHHVDVLIKHINTYVKKINDLEQLNDELQRDIKNKNSDIEKCRAKVARYETELKQSRTQTADAQQRFDAARLVQLALTEKYKSLVEKRKRERDALNLDLQREPSSKNESNEGSPEENYPSLDDTVMESIERVVRNENGKHTITKTIEVTSINPDIRRIQNTYKTAEHLVTAGLMTPTGVREVIESVVNATDSSSGNDTPSTITTALTKNASAASVDGNATPFGVRDAIESVVRSTDLNNVNLTAESIAETIESVIRGDDIIRPIGQPSRKRRRRQYVYDDDDDIEVARVNLEECTALVDDYAKQLQEMKRQLRTLQSQHRTLQARLDRQTRQLKEYTTLYRNTLASLRKAQEFYRDNDGIAMSSTEHNLLLQILQKIESGDSNFALSLGPLIRSVRGDDSGGGGDGDGDTPLPQEPSSVYHSPPPSSSSSNYRTEIDTAVTNMLASDNRYENSLMSELQQANSGPESGIVVSGTNTFLDNDDVASNASNYSQPFTSMGDVASDFPFGGSFDLPRFVDGTAPYNTTATTTDEDVLSIVENQDVDMDETPINTLEILDLENILPTIDVSPFPDTLPSTPRYMIGSTRQVAEDASSNLGFDFSNLQNYSMEREAI